MFHKYEKEMNLMLDFNIKESEQVKVIDKDCKLFMNIILSSVDNR